MKLSHKLPLLIVLPAVLSALIVGGVASYQSAIEMKKAAAVELTTINAERLDSTHRYLTAIETNLSNLASNPFTIQALKEFKAGWEGVQGDQTKVLQGLYITENPNPLGEKHKLDAASDGSNYSDVHLKNHPWFRSFLESQGYYDIFLFDANGDLLYTVFKELDYATNLQTGQWKDTDLGNAFRQALSKTSVSDVSYFDFKPYAPSADAPAAFVSAPILENGKVIGVLAFQMPIDVINDLLSNDNGLGRTGETVIVGTDFLARNDSSQVQNAILQRRLENPATIAAMDQKAGIVEYTSETGEPMLAAYAPMSFLGTRYAFIAQITDAEIYAPLISLLWGMLFFVGCVAAIFLMIGLWAARRVVSPINNLTTAMLAVSGGRYDLQIPSTDRTDEIGDMAEALLVFKQNGIENQRLQLERIQQEKRATEMLVEGIQTMADAVETESRKAVDEVLKFSERLTETAQGLSESAITMRQNCSSVSAAASDSLSNSETVASASEELSASINEISDQVGRATGVASVATNRAESTRSIVGGLAESVDKVGEVIAIIAAIAEQTNLLALNATIEAARAGDAGKGFAVVASEVKSLASQTQRATDDIGAQIRAIQDATGAAVNAISEILGVIDEVAGVTSSIAGAVEEQNAATREIAQNVSGAASAARDVSNLVLEVTQESQSVGDKSKDVLQISKGMEEQMQQLMATLIKAVRSAMETSSRQSA